MAEYDSSSSSSSTLVCTEMNDDDVWFDDEVGGTRVRSPFSSCFEDDDGRSEGTLITNNTIVCISDEQFISMISCESDYMPKDDYFCRLTNGILDLSMRQEALNWMLKAYIQLGFGGVVFFLSMNYFDRFLSLYDLPQDKAWAVQLLAVACLSIASKMEEFKVPLTVDLQAGEPKYVFEGKTICRMELLVLTTLKWKLRAHTPISFIHYFISKISEDPLIITSLISNATKLVLTTTKVIDFLEFKPSEIGAAVSILAGIGKQALYDNDIHHTLATFVHIEKEKVLKCIGMIEEEMVEKKKRTRKIKGSPDRVLEGEACSLSYNNNNKSNIETTVESCLNYRNICRENKSRKLQHTSY